MSKVTPQIVETFTPQQGDTCQALPPMAMPPMPPDPNQPGKLCFCNGKVTRNPSAYLYGIAIRCKQGTLTNAQFPNSEVTQGSPNSVYIAVGAFIGVRNWESTVVPAFGNTTAVPNTMKVVARYFTMSGAGAEESTLTHFNGIWTDVCPPQAATAAGKKAPTFIEPEYHPTQRDGDWLLYEGLPVSALGAGNLLSRNGVPLKAEVLAVAAARVHWWSNLNDGVVVRRPIGDIAPTGLASACPFPGLPRNAIIIQQPQQRHVLMSQCRDRPDYFTLNRNEKFHIQVNFESPVLPSAQLLSGSYDLWVKVVD